MNARVPFSLTDIANLAPVDLPPSGLADVENGVVEGCYSGSISNRGYHALRDYLSHSGAKQLLRSPAHYQAYCNDPDDPGVKPNFGTAVHSVVLESADFDKEYIVYDGRRQGAKWDAFAKEHKGKLILNEKEYKAVLGCYESVINFRDYPLADALKMGQSEKSIFWTDRETGVKCRVRIDSLNPCVIFDIKTIDDSRPASAISQIMRMDYDLQAAMYVEGVRQLTGKVVPFYFIFVEDKAPHGVWLICAGESIIESGTEKFRKALRAFSDLQRTQDYHGYLNAVSTAEVPRWYKSKN